MLYEVITDQIYEKSFAPVVVCVEKLVIATGKSVLGINAIDSFVRINSAGSIFDIKNSQTESGNQNQ